MATSFNQAHGIFLAGDGSVDRLKEVYAEFNGQKIPAKYDVATGLWSVETVAPAMSSWSQPGHVYAITLIAEDLAGNIATITNTDPAYGPDLQIRVLETTKPVAIFTYPTQGSIIGHSDITIVMDLSDTGGSGLNMESLEFAINGVRVNVNDIFWEDSENGHTIGTYEANALSDGQNLLTLEVSDYDGNISVRAETLFTISTIAPTLTVTKPAEDLITNVSPIHIEGFAAPGTSSVSLISVSVNGIKMPLSDDGSFSYDYEFDHEGENILEIVATDSIGKSTVVVRKIVYDTTLPIITDIVAEAVVVNVGDQIRVTFRVEDPGDRK